MSSVYVGSRVRSYSHSAAGGFVVQAVAYTTVVRTSDYVLKGRFLQTRTTGLGGFPGRLNHFMFS